MPSRPGVRERSAPRFLSGAGFALVLLSIPVLFYGLGNYSLVSGDEGFYHYVAREMVRSGDWLTLRFVGETQLYETFLNAPIHYWLKAILISVAGDGYWTMRILAASFAMLTVLATHRLALSLAGPAAAFLAALAQLTTFQFVYWHSARTGELEPIVSFLVVAAAYLFLRALESGRGFLMHHACLVLLVNTKLPMVLLPLLAEGVFFAVHRRSRSRLRDWARSGLLLVPLAFLWHGYQALIHRAEVPGVLLEMLANTGGVTSVGERASVIGHNLWFYLSWMWRGAFPYVLVYPIALCSTLAIMVKKENAAPSTRAELTDRARLGFIVLQTITIFAFYVLIEKKLAWYVVPCYPFLSVLTAMWLERIRVGSHRMPTLFVIAAILTGVLWIRFPIMEVNPFASTVRWSSEIETSWRVLLGVGVAIGAPITFAVLVGAQLAARARVPVLAQRTAVVALAATLVAVATARTVAPLRFVHHESEMEAVRASVAQKRAAGAALTYPIELREQGILKAEYFFGDDFDVRPRFNVRDGVYFELHPKPSAERSR